MTDDEIKLVAEKMRAYPPGVPVTQWGCGGAFEEHVLAELVPMDDCREYG